MTRSKLTLKIDLIDSEVDDFCTSVHALYGAATLKNMERYIKDSLNKGASIKFKQNTRYAEPSNLES